MRRARAEAERAIALDPTLPDSYTPLGYWFMLEKRYAEADRQIQKTLELNPNYMMGHSWRAVLRLAQGRLDDGLRGLEKTAELDPLWAVNLATLGEILIYASRFDEALKITDRVNALRPDIYIPSFGYRARALLALGRREEAIETARLIRTHLTKKPRREADASAIWVLREAGLPQEAAAYGEELYKTLPDTSHQRGFALGALGRFDEALPYLEETPQSHLRRLYWDSIWDPWRNDPRFKQLSEKLGCVEEYKLARETLARMTKAPPLTPSSATAR